MLASNLNLILETSLVKPKLDCALLAHALAIALLMQVEFIDMVRMVRLLRACQWDQTQSVHDELVM